MKIRHWAIASRQSEAAHRTLHSVPTVVCSRPAATSVTSFCGMFPAGQQSGDAALRSRTPGEQPGFCARRQNPGFWKHGWDSHFLGCVHSHGFRAASEGTAIIRSGVWPAAPMARPSLLAETRNWSFGISPHASNSGRRSRCRKTAFGRSPSVRTEICWLRRETILRSRSGRMANMTVSSKQWALRVSVTIWN